MPAHSLDCTLPATRRPYPAFGTINYIEDRGKSIYHGWQTQFEKRFSRGISLLTSYAYSKAIDGNEDMYGRIDAGNQYPVDPRNLALERSLSGQHVGQRLTYNMILEVPFGRGRLYGGNLPAFVNFLAGGWDLSTTTSFFSGSPFSPQTSVDACGCGLLTGSKRPNRLRDGNIPEDQRTIQRWYDPTAFAVPQTGTLGDSGRNILLTDGTRSVNLSLMKNFQLREKFRFQFRVEAFNALNNTNLGFPNLNIETAGAGQIATSDPARQVQLALKFQF